MYFYVSWYTGDPWYSLYDDDCAMPISIASVSCEWTLSSFPKLPRRPILDAEASSNEKDRCIDQTIAYAYEFRELLRRADHPDGLRE